MSRRSSTASMELPASHDADATEIGTDQAAVRSPVDDRITVRSNRLRDCFDWLAFAALNNPCRPAHAWGQRRVRSWTAR
jgi:hypothetical protein